MTNPPVPSRLSLPVFIAAAALGTAVFFVPTHSARADLVDGLTALYDFDDNLTDLAHGLPGSASTTADDLSYVDGHNGAFGTGLFGSGGYAATGAGTGHAETPSSIDNNGTGDNITVQWWGKVGNFDVNWQAGVAKGEGNNWRFHRQGGDLTMAWQGGGGDIGGGAAGPAVNDGMWHHLVGTKDAVLGRVLYIDGVQVATGAAGTPLAINDALPMMVGENPQGNGRDWNGEIDDVAIWNRAITADEVAEIYNAGVAGNGLATLVSGPVLDTDGDGLPDAWEIENLGAGAELDDGTTNPDFGADGDPDADRSPNSEELARRTDPNNPDSDDDGLFDGVETGTGVFDSATDTGTSPTLPDTDDDGLLDGVEDNGGVFVNAEMTGTDPNNPDSDDDRVSDGDEVALGRDPNIPDIAPPATGILDGLTAYYNFDENLIDQAHLTPGSASTTADDLAYVDGHTGAYGPGLFGSGGYAAAGAGTGHAETPSSVDNNGTGDSLTVQWWGKVNSFDVNWQAGVAKGEGNNWRFHRQGGDQTVAWQGGGGDIGGGAAGPNVNDAEWHHFVGTKDPADGRVLYIDGVLVATGAAGTPLAINDALPMMVGENPQGNGRDWNGEIDDVAIWNRALTQEEVTTIYNNGVDGNSLISASGGAGFRVTEILVNPDNTISLTWESRPDHIYAVDLSFDLTGWPRDVDDGVSSMGESTTYSFANPEPGARRIYFRVRDLGLAQ